MREAPRTPPTRARADVARRRRPSPGPAPMQAPDRRRAARSDGLERATDALGEDAPPAERDHGPGGAHRSSNSRTSCLLGGAKGRLAVSARTPAQAGGRDAPPAACRCRARHAERLGQFAGDGRLARAHEADQHERPRPGARPMFAIRSAPRRRGRPEGRRRCGRRRTCAGRRPRARTRPSPHPPPRSRHRAGVGALAQRLSGLVSLDVHRAKWLGERGQRLHRAAHDQAGSRSSCRPPGHRRGCSRDSSRARSRRRSRHAPASPAGRRP